MVRGVRPKKAGVPRPAAPSRKPPVVPRPVWEPVPDAAIADHLKLAAELLAAAFVIDNGNGPERLTREQVERASDPESLRALIEEDFPQETRMYLSTEPINKRKARPPPFPPFDQLPASDAIDRRALVKDVVTLLELAHVLLATMTGRGAPLPHEIAAVAELRATIGRYIDAHGSFTKRIGRVWALARLTEIYKEVAESWAHASSGTGETKLGSVKTKEQREAIAEARVQIERFLSASFERLTAEQRAHWLDELLVDGKFIRKQGPAKTAAQLLAPLFGASERTLLGERTVSHLEASRAGDVPRFLPPAELWTKSFRDKTHAAAYVGGHAAAAADFAHSLIIELARDLPGAPSDGTLAEAVAKPGLHERRAANHRPLGVSVPEDIIRQVRLACDAGGISISSYILALLAKDGIS